ncbi:MAG: hypothetical protein GXP34_02810 [Actinobacteria bacterium]|nr:hypothetical protein [Actinomycetota bacterium]
MRARIMVVGFLAAVMVLAMAATALAIEVQEDHFRTGRGYSHTTERFGILESYDERDWRPDGYDTGKRRYVPFQNLWDATRTHWAHNIGA